MVADKGMLNVFGNTPHHIPKSGEAIVEFRTNDTSKKYKNKCFFCVIVRACYQKKNQRAQALDLLKSCPKYC